MKTAAGGLADEDPVAVLSAGCKNESDPDTALCDLSKGETVTRNHIANWFPGDADAAGPGSFPQTRARSALIPLGTYPRYDIICFPAAPRRGTACRDRRRDWSQSLAFESQPSPVYWQGALGK